MLYLLKVKHAAFTKTNERLTDGETEATLKNVLTYENVKANIPALYKGKTPTEDVTNSLN